METGIAKNKRAKRPVCHQTVGNASYHRATSEYVYLSAQNALRNKMTHAAQHAPLSAHTHGTHSRVLTPFSNTASSSEESLNTPLQLKHAI